MRISALILISCLIISCKDSGKKNDEKSDSKSSSIETSPYVSNDVIDSIKSYYYKAFSEDSITLEDMDTLLTIRAISKEDIKNGSLLAGTTIYISKSLKDYISGDINNDGQPDLVTSVSFEWGASNYARDIVTLVSNAEKYQIADIKNSTEVCGCDDNEGFYPGMFLPTAILNGKITGTSDCWAKDDPHCCPSLKYNTIVELKNNKLSFVKREKVAD